MSLEKFLKKQSDTKTMPETPKITRTPPGGEERDSKRKKEDEGEGSILVEILSEIKKLREEFRAITKEVSTIKEEITKIHESQRKEKEENGRRMAKAEEEVETLKEKIKNIEEKCNRKDREERKKNLIIRGLKETREEDTKEIIYQLFEEKLGVRPKVDQATRMGRMRGEEECRAVKVRFSEVKEKWLVTDKKQKLKGSRIYIDEDYPEEVWEKRKRLIAMAQRIRKEEGKRVFVQYDRIKIDGEIYELVKENGEEKLLKNEGRTVGRERKPRNMKV